MSSHKNYIAVGLGIALYYTKQETPVLYDVWLPLAWEYVISTGIIDVDWNTSVK